MMDPDSNVRDMRTTDTDRDMPLAMASALHFQKSEPVRAQITVLPASNDK